MAPARAATPAAADPARVAHRATGRQTPAASPCAAACAALPRLRCVPSASENECGPSPARAGWLLRQAWPSRWCSGLPASDRHQCCLRQTRPPAPLPLQQTPPAARLSQFETKPLPAPERRENARHVWADCTACLHRAKDARCVSRHRQCAKFCFRGAANPASSLRKMAEGSR